MPDVLFKKVSSKKKKTPLWVPVLIGFGIWIAFMLYVLLIRWVKGY